MTHAYSEIYLNNAVSVFSEMMDYAVNTRHIDGDEFLHMFITSGAARQFESGNPRYVTGRSGLELVDEVINKIKSKNDFAECQIQEEKTPEYWAGWALAQYQWYTGKPFEFILRYLPFVDIVEMYPALHEADITKFNSVADSIVNKDPLFWIRK